MFQPGYAPDKERYVYSERFTHILSNSNLLGGVEHEEELEKDVDIEPSGYWLVVRLLIR